MRHVLVSTLAATGLLLFGLAAHAQNYGPGERGHLFDRVRADLDRAAATAAPFTGDRDRIAVVRRDMNEFQGERANGNYDPAELDRMIGALQRVVDSNRMPDPDRNLLIGDLRELREFRGEHSATPANPSAIYNAVSNLAAGGPAMRSFDDWNVLYQQVTGNPGPDPTPLMARAGYERTQPISIDQWWGMLQSGY
jgi:hypothetical protein